MGIALFASGTSFFAKSGFISTTSAALCQKLNHRFRLIFSFRNVNHPQRMLQANDLLERCSCMRTKQVCYWSFFTRGVSQWTSQQRPCWLVSLQGTLPIWRTARARWEVCLGGSYDNLESRKLSSEYVRLCAETGNSTLGRRFERLQRQIVSFEL